MTIFYNSNKNAFINLFHVDLRQPVHESFEKSNYYALQTDKDSMVHYREFPKYSDTPKICSNHSKIWTMWLNHRVICPNDADGMEQSDLGLHCLPRHICPKI